MLTKITYRYVFKKSLKLGEIQFEQTGVLYLTECMYNVNCLKSCEKEQVKEDRPHTKRL